jgi:molecular chaperone GrpE
LNFLLDDLPNLYYLYVMSAEETDEVSNQETAPPTAPTPAAPTPEEQVAALEVQLADTKDQLLRKAADFDNYRKRMIREKQDAIDYANASLLGDLLDSIDNLDRALEAAKTAGAVDGVVEGVTMVKTQLVSMLENKYSLTSYAAKGDPFDPNAHEGISSVTSEVTEARVGDVYLKGYKLKDRVIRHAKVQVLTPGSSPDATNKSETVKEEDVT